MSKIKIVGSPTSYDFDEVKDTVIFLGGRYYFKHDEENLIKVKTPTGYKLYRKESPLIVRTISGTYAKKSDCIKTSDDLYFEKNHPDTVKLDSGEYTHKKWCVTINNKYYLKTDPLIVPVKSAASGYALKETTILLDEATYGKNCYDIFDPERHVKIGKAIYLVGDIREIISWDKTTESIKLESVPRAKVTGRMISGVFKAFKDGSNPQIGRYDTAYALETDVLSAEGIYILKDQFEWFVKKIEELKVAELSKVTEKARQKCNSNFGDVDETENTAKIITKDYQTWPGKQRIFGRRGKAVISKSLKSVGGLGYAFGVEIETSAGVANADAITMLGAEAVGDRSIGAAEYVTPILHGDKGIEYLKELAKICAAATFVDDRCSIHVHVGPAPSESLSCWPLKFNKEFAIGAIKLGCSIEEELYQMLPKARSPYNRHCHSIQRFRNIDEDNWKEYVGAFVFGPQENWKSTMDFRNYKYGEGSFSKSHSLSTWCGGRYKWLNLVRCFSQCDSPTVELRIWSPTTNFEKMYAYVLLSLAFTHVVSTQYHKIMKGEVNLTKMVELGFPKNPDLQEFLLSFISLRKKKFNRTNVYNTIPLDQIVTVTSVVKKEPKKLATTLFNGLDPWD